MYSSTSQLHQPLVQAALGEARNPSRREPRYLHVPHVGTILVEPRRFLGWSWGYDLLRIPEAPAGWRSGRTWRRATAWTQAAKRLAAESQTRREAGDLPAR